MLVRCSEITMARAAEESSATSSARTKPAPIAPSTMIKKRVTAAAMVAWRRPKASPSQPVGINPRTPHSPLVSRWVYSMSFSVDGAEGMISPSHSSGCAPQPAPVGDTHPRPEQDDAYEVAVIARLPA